MSLHVEVAGDGPPLVLLHGWAMHGGVFGALVDALRDRWTLHVVDLPGHGRSRDSTVPLALGTDLYVPQPGGPPYQFHAGIGTGFHSTAAPAALPGAMTTAPN